MKETIIQLIMQMFFFSGNNLDFQVVQKCSRRGKKTGDARMRKTTRRIYVCWKQAIRPNLFSVVPVRRGGGYQAIDFDKNCSLDQLKKIIVDYFFPEDVSLVNDKKLTDVTCVLASYNGHVLPETVLRFTTYRWHIL